MLRDARGEISSDANIQCAIGFTRKHVDRVAFLFILQAMTPANNMAFPPNFVIPAPVAGTHGNHKRNAKPLRSIQHRTRPTMVHRNKSGDDRRGVPTNKNGRDHSRPLAFPINYITNTRSCSHKYCLHSLSSWLISTTKFLQQLLKRSLYRQEQSVETLCVQQANLIEPYHQSKFDVWFEIYGTEIS
jgi:hypothetical protein